MIRPLFLAALCATGLISSESLAEGSPTLAPFAYVKFCNTHPGDCKFAGKTSIKLNGTMLSQLETVNRRVNRKIKPAHEVGDTWSVDVKEGDCEDYVLTKRRALVRRGFPPAALRIAVATTPSGEGHAVLVVKTDLADLVLDNRMNGIRKLPDTDLTLLKIQSGSNAFMWRTL